MGLGSAEMVTTEQREDATHPNPRGSVEPRVLKHGIGNAMIVDAARTGNLRERMQTRSTKGVGVSRRRWGTLRRRPRRRLTLTCMAWECKAAACKTLVTWGCMAAACKNPKSGLVYGKVSILVKEAGAPMPSSSEPKRTSIFDRISIDVPDKRLTFTTEEVTKPNYLTVVGKKETPTLKFFPLSDKRQSTVTLPIELARAAAKTYRTTLFGYFLGPRLHFPLVQSYVKQAWGKYGFKEAMMNDMGMWFFKFNDEGGCLQVAKSGPLMIKGVPSFDTHGTLRRG